MSSATDGHFFQGGGLKFNGGLAKFGHNFFSKLGRWPSLPTPLALH